MARNLGKEVVDFLTAHPDEKFSARQIAEWIFATFPDECTCAHCGIDCQVINIRSALKKHE